MANAKTVLTIALLNIVITGVAITGYDRFFSTKIVTIDTTAFINEVQAKFVKGEIDETQVDKRLLELKSVINAQAGNKIILIKDMVVSKNVETIKL